MIYTVTLNPAIDKTVVIHGFSENRVNRIQHSRIDAGGKGINVSKCISLLGGSSIAVVLLAGDSGKWISSFLRSAPGITTMESWCQQGETRTNLKIIDPERHHNTDINELGPTVGKAVLTEIQERLLSSIKSNDTVLLSGSQPEGAPATLYREWSILLREKGARIFLDADGKALTYGVDSMPFLLKPNREELSELCAQPLMDQEALIYAGRTLLGKGSERIVISMGGDGALFLSKEEQFQVTAPQVTVRSTVGAGDSMVAALAFGMSAGLPWREQAKLAVACGCASVTRSGTEPPSLSDVQALFQQVHIRDI